MTRSSIIEHLHSVLQERITALRSEITSAQEARNDDTKSSAGDKHEVGREMVQIELDKLTNRLNGWYELQNELDRVPNDRIYEKASFGSLVNTDQGQYFMAIGLGQMEHDGEKYFAISLASPIGQALKDKRVGEVGSVNGRKITIQDIS